MSKQLPIGESDFRDLREADLEYIDKTHLIEGLIDDRGSRVSVFPRPRRFGKTLNLSMLRYFLERRDEDLSHLFEGLHVWSAGDVYRAHFQRYPVVFLTFKDLKPTNLEVWSSGLRQMLSKLFLEHLDLAASGVLAPVEARDFESIVNRTADEATMMNALERLTTWLHRRHGERVVVLIDEYDTPIHAAVLAGFGEPVLNFFRTFLGAGLKDTVHLQKAVVTGILRVAKENIFSGLNNPKVYSLLRQEYADCFGFTEAEVEGLLERAGQADCLEQVRTWYNGYVFGGQVIYNPWSVLNFADNPDKTPQPYWVNTSANDLVREHLIRHALAVEDDVRKLLDGTPIEKPIDDNIVLAHVQEDPGSLWSLLLFSGYLKASRLPVAEGEEARYELTIPNLEVRKVYLTTFQGWMDAQLPGRGIAVQSLLRAMFEGEAERFELHLGDFAKTILSHHDRIALYPEAVYHGFLLGLCAVLEPTHRVRSNRESGLGRPDVLILPSRPASPGVALELKVARRGRKTLDQALTEGLEQLRSMDYTAELRQAGAAPIRAYAVAFDGKTVRVARPEEPDRADAGP